MNTFEQDLIKRAVVLFPRKHYLKMSSVRHARRQWVLSQIWLQCTRVAILKNQAG